MNKYAHWVLVLPCVYNINLVLLLIQCYFLSSIGMCLFICLDLFGKNRQQHTEMINTTTWTTLRGRGSFLIFQVSTLCCEQERRKS